jgi:hypothetical protein
MSDIAPVQSIAVIERPADPAILSIQTKEQKTLLFSLDENLLLQLNSEIVDVLLHREHQ